MDKSDRFESAEEAWVRWKVKCGVDKADFIEWYVGAVKEARNYTAWSQRVQKDVTMVKFCNDCTEREGCKLRRKPVYNPLGRNGRSGG